MQIIPPGTPRPSYTARQFADISDELLSYIGQIRPDLLADFTDTSTLGNILLDLMAIVGDQIAFGQDAAASERFLAFTRRYDTALLFARSVGYVPRTATAATVDVLAGLPAAVTAAGGTIAAGQTISSSDGVPYELLADVSIISGATTANATLTEGQSWEETFDPSNRSRMLITVENGVVADGSWKVYVGTPGVGTLWTEVEYVALETTASNTYQVGFDTQGRLEIQFGDGVAGAIPGLQITVRYRTTLGSQGNRPIGSLSGQLTIDITADGDTDVTFSNSGDAATGGYDRETVEAMRVNIPAFVRNRGTFNDIRDYDAAPRRVAGVALSYADLARRSYQANIVKVGIWQSEDVTFTSESLDPPRRSSVGYTRYVQASAPKATEVQTYLRDRTSVAVFPQVLRPTVAWVDLYIPEIHYDFRYAAAAVHEGVTAAVVAAFTASNGFGVSLSRVYDAVRQVPGVESLTIDRVVFEYSSKARAAGTVVFSGVPADGNTITLNQGSGPVVFEFDSNAAYTGGHLPVTIGLSAHETMVNFVTAVTAAMNRLTVVKTSSSTPTATVTHKDGGASYNLTITKFGTNITVTGLTGGSDTVSTVREDRRRDVGGFDPWPSGTYTPGEPFIGVSPWVDGGITPYYPMSDPMVALERLARPFYRDAYVYNNEIVYSQGAALATEAQAVNLRRLVFELVEV